MSSVLDALTLEQRAEMIEALDYRHLRRALAGEGVARLLEFLLIREIPVTQPAAGVDWSLTVPGGSTWEPISVQANLVTSAVVGNRYVRLEGADQAGVYYRAAAAAAATAGITTRYSWALGYGAITANNGNGGLGNSLASVPLGATSTFGPTTVSLDTGDQWSNVVVTVREWSPPRVIHAIRYLLTDLDSAGGIE